MTDKKWSKRELSKLEELVAELGFAWLEIGNRLGRSQESVRMAYRNHMGETNASGKMADPTYISQSIPRVGLFDLETLPMELYGWNLRDEYTGIEQVISGTGLLSWAGKFLNEPTVYSDILTSSEAKEKHEERIVKTCWDFLHSCDVVIGHNLIDFDSKVANAFFLKYDLPPLKYVQVDTLKIARRHFRLDSNKMAFINRMLGIRQKIENEGFPLWRKCREGDAEALRRMKEYNEGDVLALEELFYKLRPYAHSSFNVALFNEIEGEQCPVCGSVDLKSDGFYYTSAGRYEALRCQNCKCLSRRKQNQLGKSKRKSLLVNS